jgi:hypothetical protein
MVAGGSARFSTTALSPNDSYTSHIPRNTQGAIEVMQWVGFAKFQKKSDDETIREDNDILNKEEIVFR